MDVTEAHCHVCRRLCWSDHLSDHPPFGSLCEECVRVLVTGRLAAA